MEAPEEHETYRQSDCWGFYATLSSGEKWVGVRDFKEEEDSL